MSPLIMMWSSGFCSCVTMIALAEKRWGRAAIYITAAITQTFLAMKG